MNNYIYSQVDRLNKPNTYMYTEYIGESFLDIYNNNRNSLISYYNSYEFDYTTNINNLSILRVFEISINKFIDKYQLSHKKFNYSKLYKLTSQNNKVNKIILGNKNQQKNVSEILDNIIIKFNSPEFDLNQKTYLHYLLRKFEVTKKLFSHYDSDFKKPIGDFDNLEIYLKMQIALIIYYIDHMDIRYLNTILKISDTLCSQSKNNLNFLPNNFHQITLYSELLLIKQIRGLI